MAIPAASEYDERNRIEGRRDNLKIRTILIALAVLVVVVIGGLFIAISSVDINSYKGLIAEEAEKATGRKLVIAGDADLSISLTPSISVSSVSFANAPWGSRPEMAKLKNVSVEVALMPLISGDLQVNRLVLSGLDLLIETNGKGRGNWLFDAPEKPTEAGEGGGSGGAATLPTVKLVVLEDILVTYRDGKTGESHQIKVARLEARADNAAAPLDFTLEAALNNQPIKASGRLGALAAISDTSEPWPMQVKLSAGGAEIGLKGTINNPMAAEGMSLDLSLGGQSLSTLSDLAGATLPKLGPYAVAGKLVGSPQDLKIEGLALKMGGSDIGGSLRVRLGGKVPRIDANLKSGKLDVADFSAGEKPKAAAKAAPAASGEKKKRVFPTDPLPLDGLAAVNANITVTLSKLLASGMVLEDMALNAKLEGGKADLSLKKAKLSGGALSGAVSLDGRKGKSGLIAKVKVAKLDIGRLLKEMKVTDLLTAKMDAGVDLKRRGSSVRQIMAGLNGKLTATSIKGRIGSKYVDLLAADLLTNFVPGGPDKKDTEFNCLVVGFDNQKGHRHQHGAAVRHRPHGHHRRRQDQSQG